MSTELIEIRQSIQAIARSLESLEKRVEQLGRTCAASRTRPCINPDVSNAPPPGLLPCTTSSSDPLLHSVNALLAKSLAKSTLSGYGSTVHRFLTFCAERNIAPTRQFPAEETVLCAFAASFATRATGGSVANAMAALKTWHALHNVEWQGGQRLAYVIKATANCAPPSSARSERPGVTLEHLRSLYKELDLRSPKDAAVYAVACVAFWGMCRLGELLGTSRRRHDPSRFPSRSSLTGLSALTEYADLHLPCTKTSQHQGATIRLLVQHGRVDPIFALRNHLFVNNTARQSDHLFAYCQDAHGPARCVTNEEFLVRCNQIWQAAGFQRLSGHNFRIGGANLFLDREVPSDIVKSMGRWKSGAFYSYWRKPEDKAVRFARQVTDPSHSRGSLARDVRGRLAPPAHVA